MATIDPVSTAQQLVSAERANMDALLQKQQKSFKAQLDAINSLSTKLSSFQTQIKDLNKASVLQAQKTTFSQDGVMTVTSNGKAVSGQYTFQVTQLAERHQVGISLGGENDPLPTSGVLTLSVAGKDMAIDFSTLKSGATVKDLVSEINNATASNGIKASLVRSNGQVNLLLASKDTGTANAMTMSFSGDASSTFGAAFAARKDVTAAKNAELSMGSGTGAIKIVSSTNKLENVVDGLSISLLKAQKTDDAPLQMSVSQDTESVTAALKKLVDGYNEMVTQISTLTSSSTTSPGALSSDGATRALKSVLTRAIRDLPNGMTLASLGISTDKEGKLSFKESDFTKALEKDPELLGKAFMGDDGLLKKMSAALDPYTQRNGVLKGRKEGIEKSQARVTERMDALDRRMELTYKRYLNQFTTLNQMMQTMQTL
jgi:flagellar hook-associated protein 2